MHIPEDKKITCRVIIQMAGKPKDHLEKTLKSYIKKLKEENKKELKVVDEYISRPKKDKETGSFYNIFAELEIDFYGPENITLFCIDYLPASVEVLEPESLSYDAPEFTGFLNDLLSKLHSIDLALKNKTAENELLKQNGVVLAKNLLMVILSKGKAKIGEITKLAGMPESHARKFLEELINEGKIKKESETYMLA